MNPILKKLHLQEKRFVTAEEIKEYCSAYNLNYYTTIRNLTSRKYLLRIFRGIFYVKSFEELKLGKMEYSHLELISKGLESKGIDDWYFGLYTALKLSNITHEYFPIDYIINDKIFRQKPIDVGGYKFKFIKLKESLVKFGLIENRYKYSDHEKTILDFMYVWKYNGVPKEKILIDISDYAENISIDKIERYALHYPKTIKVMVEELI
jgi:predicted transcriptional regulator of viral defense system